MLLLFPLLGSGCKSPFRQVFVFSSDASTRTGLVAVQNGVVFGTETGAVIRLSQDGQQIWRAELGQAVAATPAVNGEVVTVATVGGDWRGLSAATGKDTWSLSAQAPVFTPLASDGRRAFGVGQDGSITAVDGSTGAIVWKHPAVKDFRSGQERIAFPRPVHAAERLIVARREAGLVALDASSGKWAWGRPAKNIVGLSNDGDRVLVVSKAGKVSLLAAGDGSPVWEVSTGSAAIGEASPALGYIWVGLENNELAALSPQTGRELWRTVTPGPVTASVAELNRVVLVPTNSGGGFIRGLNPGRTTPVAEARLDSHLRSSPVIFQSRFLILARDGRVFGFDIVEAPAR